MLEENVEELSKQLEKEKSVDYRCCQMPSFSFYLAKTLPPPPPPPRSFRVAVGGEKKLAQLIYCDIDYCSQDYLERSKYISEQLSALKTQMEDLKVEERLTHNDHLHEEIIRLGSNKRTALEKVCMFASLLTLCYTHTLPSQSKSGTHRARIAFYEEL